MFWRMPRAARLRQHDVRVLFDQGTPVPLRRHLTDWVVETAYERGWSRTRNGDLLAIAEANGFVVLVMTDMNMRYQQNLTGRRIAIVALSTTSWPRIRLAIDAVRQSISQAAEGAYIEVIVP